MLPDPRTRPAALALASTCPESMWPTVREFMRDQRAGSALARFKAAAALAASAESDDEFRAWCLVVDYLQEAAGVSDV